MKSLREQKEHEDYDHLEALQKTLPGHLLLPLEEGMRHGVNSDKWIATSKRSKAEPEAVISASESSLE